MASWVKVLVVPCDLSSIPEFHVEVERGNEHSRLALNLPCYIAKDNFEHAS